MYKYLLFLIVIGGQNISFAQNSNVKIEIEPKEYTKDEDILIKIIIQNTEDYDYSEFPDFPGLKKGTKKVKHNKIKLNNHRVRQHTISQEYIPISTTGNLKIPDFEMTVNSQKIEVKGKKFVSEPSEDVKNIEVLELNLNLNKSEIFVGEGVKVTLGFYLAEKTTTQFQFPENISEQVERIAKIIKPKDCLESRRTISNIVGKKVKVNNENYMFFNLIEVIYYPLNNNNITFESVVFKMKKQYGSEWEDYPLKTKTKTLKVKQLPNHPLREKVSVGVFQKEEFLKKSDQYTGDSFEYKFKIIGEGNFKTVNIEKVATIREFDFFESNIRINQTLGIENGHKEFEFKILPKDSGSYNFSNYFNFIYFNTQLKQYDTLSSSKIINVLGESIKDNKTVTKDIYYNINNLITDGRELDFNRMARILANIIVVALIIILIYLYKKH